MYVFQDVGLFDLQYGWENVRQTIKASSATYQSRTREVQSVLDSEALHDMML